MGEILMFQTMESLLVWVVWESRTTGVRDLALRDLAPRLWKTGLLWEFPTVARARQFWSIGSVRLAGWSVYYGYGAKWRWGRCRLWDQQGFGRNKTLETSRDLDDNKTLGTSKVLGDNKTLEISKVLGGNKTLETSKVLGGSKALGINRDLGKGVEILVVRDLGMGSWQAGGQFGGQFGGQQDFGEMAGFDPQSGFAGGGFAGFGGQGYQQSPGFGGRDKQQGQGQTGFYQGNPAANSGICHRLLLGRKVVSSRERLVSVGRWGTAGPGWSAAAIV